MNEFKKEFKEKADPVLAEVAAMQADDDYLPKEFYEAVKKMGGVEALNMAGRAANVIGHATPTQAGISTAATDYAM